MHSFNHFLINKMNEESLKRLNLSFILLITFCLATVASLA